MKKVFYVLVVACLFASAGCSKDKDSSKPTIEVEIMNVGFTFWKVVSVKNSTTFSLTETNNTPFTFETNRRYKIISLANIAVHPFEFRNAANDVLISQNASNMGMLKDDGTINFVAEGNSISFTASASFKSNVASYNCANHNGMKGMVVFN